MNHYPDYDDQFDALRASADHKNQYAALVAKNNELLEMSGVLASLTQNTMAQVAQTRVLTGVTRACNHAWADLEAARSAPAMITAESAAKQLRPANIPIEELATHFPHSGSEKVADQIIAETANSRQKQYAGGRS
jgi:hypothetical protein